MAKPIDPLARSSIEAYGGIVAGIVAAFVTSWWAKGLLLALAAGLLIHVAFRSKHSINWPLWGKLIASCVILSIMGALGWDPLISDFRKSHPVLTTEQPASAVASPTSPEAQSSPAIQAFKNPDIETFYRSKPVFST
jgi:hypothetical protein